MDTEQHPTRPAWSIHQATPGQNLTHPVLGPCVVVDANRYDVKVRHHDGAETWAAPFDFTWAAEPSEVHAETVAAWDTDPEIADGRAHYDEQTGWFVADNARGEAVAEWLNTEGPDETLYPAWTETDPTGSY